MLIGNIVKLRYFEEEDLGLLMKLRSTNQSYDFFYEFEPINSQMQKGWWGASTTKANEKNFIIANHNDKAIGTAAIVGIDYRSKKCEFGRFMIDDESSVLGAGAEAELLALNYAFNHLNMRKVYVEVFVDNSEVIRLHKQFGFVQEGVLVEHVYKNGIYKDVSLLALYKDRFEEKKIKVEKTLSRINRSK